MSDTTNKNKTNLAYVLNAIDPLIENFGVDILSPDFAWSLVLGVFPCQGSENEERAMEINRRDCTYDKAENIVRLTTLAEPLSKRFDYSDSNVTEFSYAVRQLIRYTEGDEVASKFLEDLRNIYISFITSYYYQALEFDKKAKALKKLKNCANEILQEDQRLRDQIISIMSYKPLN